MEVVYLKKDQVYKSGIIEHEGFYVIDDNGYIQEGPFYSKEDAIKWIQDNEIGDISR